MSQTATVTVTIDNKLGLHARPALMFVEAATAFASDVTVRRSDHQEAVDGKSIMQMMMLAATQGTEIEIIAKGADAEKAVQRLRELVRARFHEE